jgi:hypothetical protein
VLLEALASGLPVAANPVAGPLDVIGNTGAGVLDANLGRAALAALSIPRELARARALTFSLSDSARLFVDNVFAAHWDTVPTVVRNSGVPGFKTPPNSASWLTMVTP